MVNFLRVSDVEVARFILYKSDYTSVTVTTSINDGTVYVQTYGVSGIEDIAHKFFINDCDLYITPSMYDLTEFIDGIYNIKVSFNKINGYILISTCVFIDITFKCRVAAFLKALSKLTLDPTADKTASLVYLLHYALVNGSNCGCNCVELITIFNELKNILDQNPIIDDVFTHGTPNSITDCGC